MGEQLVVATGFHTTELPIAARVRGRDGASLAETWRDEGMAAYKGTTVPEFPNLFMLVGPNTGQGHTSMIFIIESPVIETPTAAMRTTQAPALAEARKTSICRLLNSIQPLTPATPAADTTNAAVIVCANA